MRLIALVLAIMCFTSTATPHDTWSNGDPIPKWVKESCCGVSDAHRLGPEDVTQDEDGFYHVKGYPTSIPASKALPSHDGYYWIFYGQLSDGTVTPVYCFFVPLSG